MAKRKRPTRTPKEKKQVVQTPAAPSNDIINGALAKAAKELSDYNTNTIEKLTSTIGQILENLQTTSDRAEHAVWYADSVQDQLTNYRQFNDDRVKALEDQFDEADDRYQALAKKVEEVNPEAGQPQAIKKPNVALVGTLRSISASLTRANKAMSKVAVLDTSGAYAAEQVTQPTAAPSGGVTRRDAGATRSKDEEGGFFSTLKTLFTNPAVVAALAGIVYTILPKDVQENLKAFLGGFADGISEVNGKDENSGIKGLGTALKVAAGVIGVVFSAKLIGSIASAITTTIKLIKMMRGISGKKALALGVGAAAGAALMMGDDEEQSATPAPTEPEAENKPPVTSTEPAPAPAPAPPAPAAAPPAPTPAPTPEPVTRPVMASSGTGLKPGGGLGLKMPEGTIKDAISTASKRVGVDEAIMLAVAQQESGFNPSAKAGTSSAKGLYQFIDASWAGMVKKYGGAYPELNAGPLDANASAIAGALYIKENSDFLRKNNIPVNATNIYASHFLGPGGARQLLSADPAGSAAALMPGPAAANKNIFFKKDGTSRSIGEVIEVLYNKVGSKADQYASMIGSAPTMIASAPSTQTGTMVNAASNELRTASTPTMTQVASVNNTSTKGKGSDMSQPLPFLSPIADRGSLLSDTRHSTAYV